jgi:CheY-like chemotaxis protein
VRRASFLALAVALVGLAAESAGQVQPKGPPPKPQVVHATFRELVAEGRYDVAASFLQAFLDANPTDADFLEIERTYGTTAFTQLRTVPKWSDDAATEKQARANVEEAVKRSRAASEKLLRDPARVAKYIANLGASYEERLYAELELKRMGDFAVPFMVDELRRTQNTNVYAGLLGAIKQLEGHAIQGWVAALDGLRPEQQAGVVTAIASREDVLNLQTFAQSDITPYLWKVIADTEGAGEHALRRMAEDLLRRMNPGVKLDFREPEAKLVAAARTFYDRTARFAAAKTNADGTPSTVPLWVWDPMASRLTKIEEVPVGNAEEYFGLRYARWALEKKPDYDPARAVILTLAAERAMERARYGNLATAEPATFRLLSEAPAATLADILNFALNRKKTALALAMLQVLGDRGDRDAATPPAGTPARPSLFAKALTYPDPQVQFAAAVALLRSPVEVPSAQRGQIVDVLRRAAAADPGAPAGEKGTALLADPNKTRSDAAALILRGMGYGVEVFTTGRDLQRRIARASDFDLIFIDHHTPNPLLIDLVGQLHADARAANRPTFVIASTDKPREPTFDQLLVRFASLIAATELQVQDVPPVYVYNPDESTGANEKNRRATQEKRDGALRGAVASRMERLQRAVDATGLQLSAAQRLLYNLRVELITAAVLSVDYPISPESAPRTAERMAAIRQQIERQPPSPPYGVGTPTTDLLRLMERFEIDLARVPAAQKRFEEIYSRVDTEGLGLPVERFRDPSLEARIARTLRNYPAVRIIPEPYGRFELEQDLRAVYADPAQAPRDPAAKRAAQRTAVEWLSRMATGALPGYEVKPAEAELRAALVVPDLADAAIDGVAAFGSALAQQDLLSLALSGGQPLPTRTKAADATIRHIQVHGRLIPKTLLTALNEQARTEPDAALRGKFQTLLGLLDFQPGAFATQLKSYSPPIVPPPPHKEPPKNPMDPKDDKEPGKAPVPKP